jgi:hypothetical protein
MSFFSNHFLFPMQNFNHSIVLSIYIFYDLLKVLEINISLDSIFLIIWYRSFIEIAWQSILSNIIITTISLSNIFKCIVKHQTSLTNCSNHTYLIRWKMVSKKLCERMLNKIKLQYETWFHLLSYLWFNFSLLKKLLLIGSGCKPF